MQPLFCPKNDAPQILFLLAIALGTSRTTSYTSAITAHTHGMQPNCDVKRFDAKHFTQHQLCCQFSAYPACWGAPAPKPPPQKTMPRSSANFLPRFLHDTLPLLRLPPRFLRNKVLIFHPFVVFFRYNSHHIQQERPACLN